MDLTVVITSGELIYVGQIGYALNVIVDEPGGELGTIGDVFLLLLVSGHFLLLARPCILFAPTCAILVRHVIGIHGLRLVVAGEKEVNVPSKDSGLGTAREK